MLDPTTVTDTRIGILDLSSNTCRWPLWPHTARADGGGFYCGDPRWGGSVYCGVHAALAGGGSPLRGLGGIPRGVASASTDAPIRDVAEVMGDGVERASFREQARKFIAWRAERRASRRLDGFGLVQDSRKMSTNEHGCAAPDEAAPENAPRTAGVTAGETAPFSDLASAHEHYSAVSARLNSGPVAPPTVAVVAREAVTVPLVPAQPSKPERADPPTPVRDALADALALLDKIVESDSNRLALAGLRLLITGKLPGEALYLYGPSGCGKSLMAEVARRIIGPDRVLDPADAASALDVRRTMIAGPCLMTGEMPPGECSAAALIGRAVSLEISAADGALRAALLDRALAGYEVPPEARATLLASDLDVGCLVGLTRSLVVSLGAEKVVSLDAAQAAVDRFGKPDARPLRMDDIILTVARHYRISRADILSQRRTANVVRPRQIAMYLCKTLTLRSLPEIGRRMGGRDHTTVLHAVRKIEGMRQQDPALDVEIEALRAALLTGTATP